jgi:hypothetical protein
MELPEIMAERSRAFCLSVNASAKTIARARMMIKAAMHDRNQRLGRGKEECIMAMWNC